MSGVILRHNSMLRYLDKFERWLKVKKSLETEMQVYVREGVARVHVLKGL